MADNVYVECQLKIPNYIICAPNGSDRKMSSVSTILLLLKFSYDRVTSLTLRGEEFTNCFQLGSWCAILSFQCSVL